MRRYDRRLHLLSRSGREPSYIYGVLHRDTAHYVSLHPDKVVWKSARHRYQQSHREDAWIVAPIRSHQYSCR